ncbi:hypothetical protein Q1695_005526 [Nippostrongylus brasiliensis]|nr:hypothetical protein Q1695_005526 [Nippostrongylus brasiliensis]
MFHSRRRHSSAASTYIQLPYLVSLVVVVVGDRNHPPSPTPDESIAKMRQLSAARRFPPQLCESKSSSSSCGWIPATGGSFPSMDP